jgi:fructose/tagatose bisphosphate aldolase
MVRFSELLAAARRGGYAVGYFEPWDLPSLEAVLRGAERCAAPVMVGLSGIYLPTFLRLELRDFPAWALSGRLCAEQARVPVAYLFNETPYWDWAQAAVGLGFNVVMYSSPEDDAATHLRRTAELVAQAAAAGVEVQSEVGSVMHDDTSNTDPAAVADFVRQTGVAAVGVTAGNRHLAGGRYRLDLELIARLAEAAGVPLVLHGGSGAEDAELREAARLGVGQVNYGRAQILAFLETLAGTLAGDWRARDAHELLHTGLPADVMGPALEAVSAVVEAKCRVLGAAGQAGG